MKKIHLFFAALFLTGGMISAQTVSLDEAIKTAGTDIENRLTMGVKVVVLNFNAPTARLSNYVIEELTTTLVKGGKLVVVDRQNLALIQQEINFQSSGEVSDASAQEIGMKLGAQSIISGSIEALGNSYRVRFRTIEVVSAAIQVMSSMNVQKDDQITTLMGEKFNTELKKFGSGLGYGVLNIAFGLGSYIQGDTGGGLVITSGYVVSLGLITWELVGVKYDASLAGIPGTIGLGVAGVTLIFGFVKPILYNRNPKIASAINRINITLVSDDQHSNIAGIAYTHSF